MKAPVSREAVLAHAEERYGAAPEYLWARYPAYAVLRRQDSRKWFGVLMDVPRKTLGLSGGTVDILVVKCGPALAGSLRESPGILPAYHMNQEAWVTVLLDGTVPVEEIWSLLELSYGLAGPARSKTKPFKE